MATAALRYLRANGYQFNLPSYFCASPKHQNAWYSSFDEASTAFRDPLSRTIDDSLHSEDEERLVLIGQSIRKRLLVVVHTEKEDRIRIISAKSATNKERSRYEENEE